MNTANSLMGLGCDCQHLGDSTYYPNSGDIVNVLSDIVGTKADGSQYVIKAGSWFTPSVVQIETASVGKDYLKINDGTSNSPITAPYLANQNNFELANFINQKLFSPWAGAAQVISTVADATAETIQNTAQTVSSTSKVATYLVPVGLTLTGLFVAYYVYKHYVKGNEKIKTPKVALV